MKVLSWLTLLLCAGTVAAAYVPGEHDKTLPVLTGEQIDVLKGDPSVTHLVTFNIAQATKEGKDKEVGKLVLAMFGDIVPLTVNNFLQLSLNSQGFGFKDTGFHRIIKDFMVQGGNHASNGKSVYGDGRFNDENFVLTHNKQGRLSMANAGPNTNGAQFFIVTAKETPHLDGKHVVFGQLIDGFDTLQYMNTVKTEKDAPVQKIFIKSASVLATGRGKKAPVVLPAGMAPEKVLMTVSKTETEVFDQIGVTKMHYLVFGVIALAVVAIILRVSRTPGLRK